MILLTATSRSRVLVTGTGYVVIDSTRWNAWVAAGVQSHVLTTAQYDSVIGTYALTWTKAVGL